MSPSIDPVVCRATSGAQSPSSGGLIVLHQASRPPKTPAKIESAIRLRLRRMNSATIPAAPLKPSGAGSRNQSASALHAVSGAMTTIAAMILRASPAALCSMMNFALFLPASLRLGHAYIRALLSGGKQEARKLKRAQILLATDACASDEAIAASVGVGGSTVYRTKRRFVLGEEPRPGADRKLFGQG